MEQVKKQHPQTRVFILLLIILLSFTSKSSGSSSSESSKNKKHHFVLVHGSCHGAWSWYKVITLLKSRGHNVTALDLAASGVNQKNASELKSISEYFEPLTNFMASSVDEGQRVVLVGHSFGGFAISYAMEHFPHKISVAVFITAFMPSPLNVSPVYQMVISELEPVQDNRFTYDKGSNKSTITTFIFGPHYLASRLYQRSPKQDWNLATTLMRAFRLFSNDDVTKVLTLSHAKYGSVSRVYVVSEKDVLITPNLQRRIIKDNPPNRVVEIAGSDHMVMMSKPKDLYLQLQSIAANYD